MKFVKPMAILLTGILLTGCSRSSETPAAAPGTGSADPAPVQQSEQTPAAETSAETDKYAGFQTGQTVYDDHDVIIRLKEITDDRSYLNVLFDVENNMSGTLRIIIQNASIDNCTADRRRRHFDDIAPGEKGMFGDDFDMSWFQFYIEDAPSVIDLDLDIWDLDQNHVVDRCTVSLRSDSAKQLHYEDFMTPVGEMHEPHEIRYYMAGEADMFDSTCYAPQALPVHALALRRMSGQLRPVFIHPSCMGRNWGDHFYVIYFKETDDQPHTYEVTNISFNGRTVNYMPSARSTPGRGSFIRIGIPDDMEPGDVTSLTFTITCDGGSPVEISWMI